MRHPRYLIVLSDADGVANLVGERLAIGEATGDLVDGAPIRDLGEGVWTVRRPGLHIHDAHLDRRLPQRLFEARIPMVFPSFHRSERGVRCFTVHALGNFGAAEVGGEPGTLNESAPRLMTDALRRLHEQGRALPLPATFEATHHGPALELPSMFVEIGAGNDLRPPSEPVDVLARTVAELEEDDRDHVAVGMGGGHYAPHFTDLALKRHWAFGHIVARHAVSTASNELLLRSRVLTPGSEGFLFHNAGEATLGAPRGLIPRLSEGVAPRRTLSEAGGVPTSGEGGSGPGAGT